MTDERMDQAGADTRASDLSDPAAKTQPAEGGREEAEDGAHPESAETATADGTGQEDRSTNDTHR